MRGTLVPASLSFFVAACCTGCDAGPVDEPSLPDSAAGSYDFAFTTTEGYPASTPYPADPNVPKQPSAGLEGRLDLGRGSDGFEAVIKTDRWPFAERFGVEVLDRELVLSGGCTSARLSEPSRSWTDSWCVFRLPVGASGALTGSLFADGTYEFSGPYGDTDASVLSAVGTLRADATPPVITLFGRSPHGPTDAMLPWDELQAVVSEGVNATAFVDHVRVHAADAPEGDSSIRAWEPSYGSASYPEPAWIGAHLFKTSLSDWTATGHLSLAAFDDFRRRGLDLPVTGSLMKGSWPPRKRPTRPFPSRA